MENYFIGHHRVLSAILSFSDSANNMNLIEKLVKLYSRIINESSWGLFLIIKPFRYFNSGILMASPKIEETL